MTSRNSYSAKWAENIRRRGWTFALCFTACFLTMPVACLIRMTNAQNRIDRLAVLHQGTELTRLLLEDRAQMQQDYMDLLGFNEVHILLAGLAAVLLAVQGFSWMYSRRKTDLYLSVPVSAPKRYLLICGNSVLIFGFSYLFNLLLCLPIGAAYGVCSGRACAWFFGSFLLLLLGFVCIYQMALAAVMLTENVLTAVTGCAVLFVYEPVLRLIWEGCVETFFVSVYQRYGSVLLEETPLLTPFAALFRLWSDMTAGSVMSYGNDPVGGNTASLFFADGAKQMLLLVLTALAFGLAAWRMYRTRRTERYGETVVFTPARYVLEILLLVPAALLMALFVVSVADTKGPVMFICTVLTVLLGHGILQIIFERELGAALRQRPLAFTSLALSLLILCAFRFDWTGYDDYVPKAEEVAGVAVWGRGIQSTWFRPPFEDGRRYVDDAEKLNEMQSGNADTVAAVLSMAQAWQDAGRPDSEGWLQAGIGDFPTQRAQEWEGSLSWSVRYELKNGRNVYRSFKVQPGLESEALNRVLQDEAIRSHVWQIYDEAFREALPKMEITCRNSTESLLCTVEKQTLYETYLEEFAAYDYDLVNAELPVGMLVFSFPDDGEPYWAPEWEYPVYPSFTKTVALLEDNGIPLRWDEFFLDPDQVQGILVSAYMDTDRYNSGGDTVREDVTLSVREPAQIRELLKGMYPADLLDIEAGGDSLRGSSRREESDLYFTLTLKSAQEAPAVFLRSGMAPEFLKEWLAQERESRKAAAEKG